MSRYRIVLEKDAADVVTPSKVDLSINSVPFGDEILKQLNRMVALERVRKANAKATKVKKGKIVKIQPKK